MSILDRLRKKPVVTDAERRSLLRTSGRITEGVIVDTDTRGEDEIVYYLYTLNGVDFESTELLNEIQRQDLLKYAPGQKVNIRFDPKNQGNSILE
jgi:hypothetical protein